MSDLIRYHGDSKVINRLCELVNNMTGINFEVVQTLPTQDISTSTIYLVPKQTAQTENVYDEYINTDGTSQGWELIGTTEIDLSNYYTKTETDDLLDDKADIGDIPTDFVPKSTGGVFDGNVEIVTSNSGTSNVNSIFRLGNNKAVGVLGNTRGVIQIYDRNGNYTNIFASDNLSSGNVLLPKDKPNNSVLAIVGEAVDWTSNRLLGAKNLNSNLPYNETTHSESGVVFTDIGDGTIKATGKSTSSSRSGFVCHSRTVDSVGSFFLKNGTYILTGCPSGGSDSSYYIEVGRTVNGALSRYGREYGDGLTFTVNGDDNYADKAQIQLVCYCVSNYQIQNDGIVFKPMIQLSKDTDNEWQSYSMTNQQLTDYVKDKLLSIDADLNNITQSGSYIGGLSNTISNKPTSVGQFGLVVTRTAQTHGYYKQALSTAQGVDYVRYCKNNTWTSWTQI